MATAALAVRSFARQGLFVFPRLPFGRREAQSADDTSRRKPAATTQAESPPRSAPDLPPCLKLAEAPSSETPRPADKGRTYGENAMYAAQEPRNPRQDIPDDEVVEMSLPLPGWQMRALERAAARRGLTIGQMLRRVLEDFLLEE